MVLRYALLGLLARRPMTGYQLAKAFAGTVGYAWPASHSQIYPELARLLEAGLIRQTGAGPRGAKSYETTGEGLAQLRGWLRETKPDRAVRNEAGLRIFFLWLLEPEEAAAYLLEEAEFHRARLAELEHIAETDTFVTPKERAYRLALEAGIRTTRARVEWAEWALDEVTASASTA